MSSDATVSGMIGLPVGRKKSRAFRRGKGAKKHPPEHHLSNAQAALTAGDHAQAKRHAFEFAKSLNSPSSKPKNEMPVPSKASRQAEVEPVDAPTSAAPKSSGGMAKLAAILMAQKKKAS